MVGKVTTQGDRAMRAQVARRNFHLDGRGIKIGVISDSFDAFDEAELDVLSGDLPGRKNPLGYRQPVRVLRDWPEGNDEGRAMLQIITDIAPAAELLFHTAANGQGAITEQSFSKTIQALAKAGADIIVDDIGFSTTLFQDGVAAQTVDRVVNRGVTYISAIGNDGNRSYESVFRPSGTFRFRGKTYEAHDFDPGDRIDLFQDLSLPAGSEISPLLSWDQPIGNITSDFELFLVSTLQLPDEIESNLLSPSTTLFSAGIEQPIEFLNYRSQNAQSAYFVIGRRIDANHSTNHIKWISAANGSDKNVFYEYVNQAGQPEGSTIYGQPNARGAIAVGAVPVRQTPVYGINPPRLSAFSSRGGTVILFDAQGNRLQIPEIRQKPEIVAPNSVATTIDLFRPFSGTSAAAPHVAAVAALMLQRAGGGNRQSPVQLVQALQQGAIALDPPGNFRSGAGLVQADAAVLASAQWNLTGNAGNNRLQGRRSANNLFGLAGNDRLSGARGFDALFGGQGADRLDGNAGNDYLLGEAGDDRLVGHGGRDTLLGGTGADRLEGSQGNDLLGGGQGQNWLSGGPGQDTFILEQVGTAVIPDFQLGIDRFALNGQLQFQQLRFIQQQDDLLIRQGGQTLARLVGVTEVPAAQDFRSIAI